MDATQILNHISWSTLLTILIGTYALSVAVFLILENRSPQSTFAWLLLLLLFPLDDLTHLVLPVRAPTLDRHGGQVSLPGGVIEAGETYEEAALRGARGAGTRLAASCDDAPRGARWRRRP